MNHKATTAIAALLLIIGCSFAAVASANTAGAAQKFHMPDCLVSLEAATICAKEMGSKHPQRLHLSRVAFERFFLNATTSVRGRDTVRATSTSTLDTLSDSLIFNRGGIREGCFYCFTRETGTITTLDKDAPFADYGTYLTGTVGVDVNNCPRQEVWQKSYNSFGGTYGVCTAALTPLAYVYIDYCPTDC
ncbi:MAG: hypothetical protein WC763_06575 [Candidatus Paceibacterota bacterium]|jgi:hypothetical protein